MEEITKSLQNVKIDLYFSTVHLCNTAIHIQKCYIPYDILKQLTLQVGSCVIMKYGNKFYICRIYCEWYSSVVQASLSVEVFYDIALPENNVQFRVVKTVMTFATVKLDVLFSSVDAKRKWIDNKYLLSKILKKYVLNSFYFSSNSKIDLTNFESAMKINICSVVVLETDLDKTVASVSSKTKIIIDNLYTNEQLMEDCDSNIIVGYEDLQKDIVEIIECNYLYFKNSAHSVFLPVKQVLLTGPSGCGKSSLIRFIGKQLNCSIITISSHNITNSTPGENEKTLRKNFHQAFNCALSEGKCVINLEDIDVLCPKSAIATSHSRRISSQLLQLLDEVSEAVGVIVIATSNKPENIDPSAVRHGRLQLELNIGSPNEKQRGLILYHFMKLLKIHDDDAVIENISREIAVITQGYVGLDLKYVCQLISDNIKVISKTHNKKVTVFDCDKLFRSALTKIMPSSLRSDTSNVIFNIKSPDNVGGLDDVKKQIDMLIWWPLIHKKSFLRLGISRPRGILLYGPPGCAKTSLVRNFAYLRRLPMLVITPAELYSPYVGEAEKILAKVFHRARQNAPCLLFLDEIDSLIGSRNMEENASSSSETQSRVLATLLMEMDGIGCSADKNYISNDLADGDDGVIVVAATNKPENIDAALLRPGRFDKHIEVPKPDVKGRLDILKLLTKNVRLARDADLSLIAAKTEGFSGADVKHLYNETVLLAMKHFGVELEELNATHFDEALKAIEETLLNKIKTGD